MISRLDITCIRMKGWVIQMFCGPYFIFGQVVQFSFSIFHHSFLKNTCFFSANQQEVHLCLIKLSRGHKEVQGVGGGEKLTSSSPVGALVPSERSNSTSEAWHFLLHQPWLVDVKFRWNQACWCLCHPSVTWQGLVEKAGSVVQQTQVHRVPQLEMHTSISTLFQSLCETLGTFCGNTGSRGRVCVSTIKVEIKSKAQTKLLTLRS